MKNQRILDIYLRLLNGKEINRKKLAQEYGVSERSIHRDISDLRNFLITTNNISEIVYNEKLNGYILKNDDNQKLTNSEILAVSKILLDSRAFLKSEMMEIIDKLMKQCVPRESYLKVSKLIENEKFHYMELQHKKSYLKSLWEIGEAVQKHLKIEIEYEKTDKSVVKRVILPVGIMFSEYYFYVLAHIDGIDKEKYFENKDDVFPTIYRIDRVKKYRVLEEHFPIPYKDRFEEGEFRKRVQFMTGGKLQRIKFKYTGNSIEAVLDKLPTAEIIENGEGYYIVKVEVFGNGINKWILSQGKDIKIIK
ncbi:helix-turn-helix transcriptional regulator [Fusobacterium perfoetens]|uniref:helix-turn-helix transcriptional regulator n=1 Tax=Fusobacterium perfoetens TaxID=852 RepID=UPI000486A7F9|nr:transcriptional regulator [Fusobacterium perfoetens]MCI6152248.1 transcriptional regulator [Fusobacterium perfoetens]MDY3237480.1 transcriptional regulator [Fusobacterium perfoetens]